MLLLVILASLSMAVEGLQLNCECSLSLWNFNRLEMECARQGKGNNVSCEKEIRHYIPRGYEYFPGFGLYRLYRIGKTFWQAREICMKDGGDLGVPETADEAVNVFRKLMSKHKSARTALLGIWEQDGEDGHYISIHGQRFSKLGYKEFAKGEPNNANGEEGCLHMYADGLLNDNNCGWPFNFICEISLKPPLPLGYHYAEDVGFFRAYSEPKTYHEARETCEKDYALLAVPDSPLKADVMWSLLDHLTTDEIFIGVNDIKDEGKFVTETGVPFSKLSFLSWEPGEPNQWGGNEDCVTMKYLGALTDNDCDARKPFICERPL